MPLISIIIPAYNAEKSLSRTIDSLLSQESFTDFEIIIINDGSTDNTLFLADSYAVKDSRISVNTVQNGGPAKARNVGISTAKGEYIMFVDSDDMLASNALKEMSEIIARTQMDMLTFGFYVSDEKCNVLSTYSFPDAEYNLFEEGDVFGKILPELYRSNLLNQAWNKVYKLEMLRRGNVVFADYKYGEDRLFVFDALRASNKFSVIEKCFYYYISENDESLVKGYYDKKFEVCCLIDKRIRDLASHFECSNDAAKRVWDYMFSKSIISCLTQLYHPTCELTPAQRHEEAVFIVNSRQICEMGPPPKDSSFSSSITGKILRSRIIWLNILMAKTIYRVSARNQSLFVKLKQN